MRTVETVIIYRLGSLGDTIIALPSFHKIAQSFPPARRILPTSILVSIKAAPLEAILGGNGLFDHAITYPVGIPYPTKLWRMAQEICALQVSALIYLIPAGGQAAAVHDFVFFRLCGIRHIIGLTATADLQNNRIDSSTGFEEQECEKRACALSKLGAVDLAARSAWDLLLTEGEQATGRKIIARFANSPFIAINMGGKAAEKHGGVDRWIELLARLAMPYADYGFLIGGAAEDSIRAQTVTGNWLNTVVAACGRLSPRESAAALQGASVFVGYNSGPLHLAVATGMACVALFGNFDRPNKWHPYGKAHRIIHHMEGMLAVSSDQVVDAVSALLSASLTESFQA